MMHEPEKSDSVVGATKPTNKAERSAAEPVEQRTGTEGIADQQSTCRAQDRESVSQTLEAYGGPHVMRALCRQIPKVGAECLNWARSDLCGGRPAMDVPTANPLKTVMTAGSQTVPSRGI